jgi:hypothetical protein
MGGLGQRLTDAILGPISDHPLRAAAGIGALLAAAVMWVNVAASTSSATTGQTATDTAVTIDSVVAFATGHPAYPVAIIVGLAVVLFAR